MPDTVICRYMVCVKHDNKKPFYVGSFDIHRRTTQQETEAAAQEAAVREIATFYQDRMPDGVVPPHVMNIRLGHTTFIPDDYEWRRT